MKLCIYHGGCTDGIAAAWVVWKHDPTYTFYPGVYQKEPPWELIDKADNVLLVDFSYPRDVLLQIIERVKGIVTVLDHHKSAQEDLKGIVGQKCAGLFNMNRCGAMIAWDWFGFGSTYPALLGEIDKQDRWLDDRDPALIMALRSYPHKPRDESPEAWLELMTKWEFLMSPNGYQSLCQDSGIYRYYRQRIDETKGHERWITLGCFEEQNEISVPVINAPFFMASDVAGELAEEHDGVGAVWWQNKNGDVTFSLRSRGDFDVSKLAKWYGGGGHKNAAGFKVSWSLAKRLLSNE